MMPIPRKRKIKLEEKLSKELARCGVSAAKLPDLMAGLGSTICARPERFRLDDSSGWSRILTKEFPPDIPPIRIWFTFDDEYVYIQGVELLSEFL